MAVSREVNAPPPPAAEADGAGEMSTTTSLLTCTTRWTLVGVQLRRRSATRAACVCVCVVAAAAAAAAAAALSAAVWNVIWHASGGLLKGVATYPVRVMECEVHCDFATHRVPEHGCLRARPCSPIQECNHICRHSSVRYVLCQMLCQIFGPVSFRMLHVSSSHAPGDEASHRDSGGRVRSSGGRPWPASLRQHGKVTSSSSGCRAARAARSAAPPAPPGAVHFPTRPALGRPWPTICCGCALDPPPAPGAVQPPPAAAVLAAAAESGMPLCRAAARAAPYVVVFQDSPVPFSRNSVAAAASPERQRVLVDSPQPDMAAEAAAERGPRSYAPCGSCPAQIANSCNVLNLYQIRNLKSYCGSVLGI